MRLRILAVFIVAAGTPIQQLSAGSASTEIIDNKSKPDSLPIKPSPGIFDVKQKPRDLQAEGEGQAQNLSRQASDPTASLMSFGFKDDYTLNRYGLDRDSNTTGFRPVIPFKTGQFGHILRASFSAPTDGANSLGGLGDTQVFDLLIFRKKWYAYGVGAVMNILTAEDKVLGSEKWALGPSAVYIAHLGDWQLGAFTQNLFTFAGNDKRPDLNVTQLQPIVTYHLPRQWALSCGDLQMVYNWEQERFTNLPIGVSAAKVTTIAGQPCRFTLGGQYETRGLAGNPQWTVNFQFTLLFPQKSTQ